MITDLYRTEDEGEHLSLRPEEVEKGLAVAKRLYTDEVDGCVFLFEKNPIAPGRYNMSGFTYSNGMDKEEMLRAVLKTLDMKRDDVIKIVDEKN